MKGMGGGMGMGRMGGMGGMGMGHMSGMSDEEKDQHMRQMQEEMLKMHDLMTRINASQDTAERERLKEEHLQLMKTHHANMMSHRRMRMEQRMKMRQEAQKKMQHRSGNAAP